MVHDMEMLLRLSKGSFPSILFLISDRSFAGTEFDFKIAAFHHGIEAYKIPELLLAANITVATWADSWGRLFHHPSSHSFTCLSDVASV
jgi:hypothetical protein